MKQIHMIILKLVIRKRNMDNSGVEFMRHGFRICAIY